MILTIFNISLQIYEKGVKNNIIKNLGDCSIIYQNLKEKEKRDQGDDIRRSRNLVKTQKKQKRNKLKRSNKLKSKLLINTKSCQGQEKKSKIGEKMAKLLSSKYGTEEDKVGACRYENKCLRIHNRPAESQSLIIKHMYQNTPTELALAQGNRVSKDDAKKAQDHNEEFYEEVFLELANYGEVDDLIICDNIGDHMKGNVYAKFVRESEALKCLMAFKNRFYDNQQLQPQFSPVTDFSNAQCKEYTEGQCKRLGYCNYIHTKPINRQFRRSLFRQMYEEHPEYKNRSHSQSNDHESSKKKRKDKDRSDKNDDKINTKKHSRSRSPHKKYKKDKDSKKKKSKSNSKLQVGSKNSEERREDISKLVEEDEQQLDDQKKNKDGVVQNASNQLDEICEQGTSSDILIMLKKHMD